MTFNAYTDRLSFMRQVRKIWTENEFDSAHITFDERSIVREAVLEAMGNPNRDLYTQWRRYAAAEDFEKQVQCICSQKCKHVEYLKNVYNQNVIHVGRECLEYFYEGEVDVEEEDDEDFVVPDDNEDENHESWREELRNLGRNARY